MLAEVQGRTPDQIIDAFPHLTLAQVHAALSYYFDHRAEIQDNLRDDEEFVAKLRNLRGPGVLERLCLLNDCVAPEDMVGNLEFA